MGLFCLLSPLTHRARKDVTRIDSLPDDIITDILSRLPVECVLKHRRVCKRWLSLTSTSYFAHLHVKRSTTPTTTTTTTPLLLLFQEWTLDLFQRNKNNSSSDAAPIKKTKMKKIRGDLIGWRPWEYDFQIRASCNGLLVFQYVAQYSSVSSLRLLFVVCNVVTRERVTVYPPVTSPSPNSAVHALFLHPVTKEYTMLYQNPAEQEATRYDFYLYSFTTKSWRQILSFHRIPAATAATVLYNNRLHWVTSTRNCNSSIIVFDTITEKFHVMPHPGDRCSGPENHDQSVFMYESSAAERSSSLGLCLVKRQAIEIWVLAEYDDWCWTTTQVFDMRGDGVEDLRPLSVYKQELAFRLRKRLYHMNLHNKDQNAANLVDDKGRLKDLMEETILRNDVMVAFLWTASFVSLNASERMM